LERQTACPDSYLQLFCVAPNVIYLKFENNKHFIQAAKNEKLDYLIDHIEKILNTLIYECWRKMRQ